jgi:hypothetical protein
MASLKMTGARHAGRYLLELLKLENTARASHAYFLRRHGKNDAVWNIDCGTDGANGPAGHDDKAGMPPAKPVLPVSTLTLAQIEAVVAADSERAAKPTLEPTVSSNAVDPQRGGGIDKSALTLSTPRRYRNKEHLGFVARQPCLLCARKPSDAHHLRFMQPRALGSKASDEFAVPLCRIHHRAAHLAGDERAWWKIAGIDPVEIASKLWKATRGAKAINQPKVAAAAETKAADAVAVTDGKAP